MNVGLVLTACVLISPSGDTIEFLRQSPLLFFSWMHQLLGRFAQYEHKVSLSLLLQVLIVHLKAMSHNLTCWIEMLN